MSDPVLVLALLAFVCSVFGLWAWAERWLPRIRRWWTDWRWPSERRVRGLGRRQ